MGEASRSNSQSSSPSDPLWRSARDEQGETELTSADLVESSAPIPAADPLLGMVVAGRYRILRQLGAGGMGVVYEVEHIDIGKLLAMKLLTGELAQSPDVSHRFKREALAASKLHSPNTVQVFDFGVADGLTYLVMELVPGQTMSRVLKREGPMSEARLAKIVIQICNSLSEAHRLGIVHRDIKPDNVMLLRTPDGAEIVKVLDFGLAKLRDSDGQEDLSARGMILGTPYYMAPEQIRGDATDGRADIYSLGALMYLAMTGQHPFQGKSTDVLVQHLTAYPVPPHERAPARPIGPTMSRFILRAMRKDPNERFASVDQLQRQLVEDVRASGSSSVDALLDSEWVRQVATIAEPTRRDLGPSQRFATRDDVDAYERRLRQRRFERAAVLAGASLLAAAAGLCGWYLSRSPVESSVEIEPNDTPAQATPLSLGREIRANLGKRIDESHGDRDFYSFEVEGGERPYVSIAVGSLPNMAMCTLLFRRGFAAPLGQFCTGRAGADLSIPALQLDPGAYFLEAAQDTNAYGGTTPPVVENVSDSYRVLVEAAAPDPSVETEPNDDLRSAVPLEIGRPITGRIGWNRDEDVYCVAAGSRPFHVRVSARADEHGVLEVSGLDGSAPTMATRVHGSFAPQPEEGSPGAEPSATDVMSPWTSAIIDNGRDERACVRLRLVPDPWSASSGPTGASPPYRIEAVPVEEVGDARP